VKKEGTNKKKNETKQETQGTNKKVNDNN